MGDCICVYDWYLCRTNTYESLPDALSRQVGVGKDNWSSTASQLCTYASFK